MRKLKVAHVRHPVGDVVGEPGYLDKIRRDQVPASRLLVNAARILARRNGLMVVLARGLVTPRGRIAHSVAQGHV